MACSAATHTRLWWITKKKNKLLVDGVVGDETWGSLNKVQQAAVPTKPTTGKDVMKGVSDETYNKLHKLEQGYVPSDEVETAQEIRRSIEALQPEKYKSSFEDELSQLYEQIAQRKPFAYDPQTDAQYKKLCVSVCPEGTGRHGGHHGHCCRADGGATHPATHRRRPSRPMTAICRSWRS